MNRRGFLGMLGAAIAGVKLRLHRSRPYVNAALPEELFILGNNQVGGRLIANGWVCTPLSFGDYITIRGVCALNPSTGNPSNALQLFMVTHMEAALNDEHVWTLDVHPGIIPDGPWNVSERPIDGAAVYILNRA